MMARVTVVNDTPDFLDLVHDILEGDRYETVLVDSDRSDAFELVRRSKPDLLMIDLRTGRGGHGGWDIVQQVRAEPEFDGMPILMCSADLQAMREIQDDLGATRPVATLRKPFEMDELTAAIDGLLDRTGRTARSSSPVSR